MFWWLRNNLLLQGCPSRCNPPNKKARQICNGRSSGIYKTRSQAIALTWELQEYTTDCRNQGNVRSGLQPDFTPWLSKREIKFCNAWSGTRSGVTLSVADSLHFLLILPTAEKHPFRLDLVVAYPNLLPVHRQRSTVASAIIKCPQGNSLLPKERRTTSPFWPCNTLILVSYRN